MKIAQYLMERFSVLTAKITGSKRALIALPVLLGLVLCCLNLWVFPKFEGLYTEIAGEIDLGGLLLAGLPIPGINLYMPFAEILISAAMSVGIGPDLLFILLHMGLYALVFFTGCLLSGYRAGLLALLAAGLFGRGNELLYEQAIYTWFLLLVLDLAVLHRESRTWRSGLLCGLAIGSSLLVRTPLFLFAPLFVLCDRPGAGETIGAFARRSLLFLAAAYALLLPWGYLNYHESGKFQLLDGQRSDNNVVIAAMGGIYSTFGDSRKAAGLTFGESPSVYYFREISKRPFHHALVILRRLWHIFLFYPAYFALLLAALVLSRERKKALLFCLPVYYTLIHTLLALEKRYFYPMPYLLPPLLAGTLLPRLKEEDPGLRAFARKAVLGAFGVTFLAVLCVEALVLAYPARARRVVPAADTYGRASALFPGDKKLYSMKCAELWVSGADGAYLGCLAQFSAKFHDPFKAYFLAVVNSTAPETVPLPSWEERHPFPANVYSARMLRELELGDRTAARASLELASREMNPGGPAAPFDWQHQAPYQDDKKLRGLMNSDTNSLWDSSVYSMLVLWPGARLPGLLKELAAIAPLSPRLARMDALLGQARKGELTDGEARKRILNDLFRMPDQFPANGPGANNNGGSAGPQEGRGRNAEDRETP